MTFVEKQFFVPKVTNCFFKLQTEISLTAKPRADLKDEIKEMNETNDEIKKLKTLKTAPIG